MSVLRAKRTTRKKLTRVPSEAAAARPTLPRASARVEDFDFDTVMRKLDRMGTAQNRKVYPRHGAVEPMYGVSYENIKEFAKRIGTDHALAEDLWLSGNFDAQNLAAKVANPSQLDDGTLDLWARQVKCYPTSRALGEIAARSPAALTRFVEWATSSEEFMLSVAYDMLSCMVKDGVPIDDALLFSVLDRIEGQIHGAPNRARHSMLGALIAIGGSRDSLRATALAAARRIGPVHVDHGQTACQTPDAVAYIGKMVAHATAKVSKGRKAGAAAPTKAARAVRLKPVVRSRARVSARRS